MQFLLRDEPRYKVITEVLPMTVPGMTNLLHCRFQLRHDVILVILVLTCPHFELANLIRQRMCRMAWKGLRMTS